MADKQTVLCTFPSGRLRYSFAGPHGCNELTIRFQDGRSRTYDYHAIWDLVDAIRRENTFTPPPGIASVETGYGTHEYDGLYCAMRLLGIVPVRPHRSRTYKTGILVDKSVPQKGWYLWHRFGFSEGNLATGLGELLRTVYGVAPVITTAS